MVRKLSQYRSQIMGLMILWVIIFHFSFKISNPVLLVLKACGYCGVDAFIFLSGMGQYCSLHHNSSLKHFFRNRFKRILPTFYPILLLWMIYVLLTDRPHFILGFIMSNITGQAFWNNMIPRFDWYMEAIWVFYGSAPLIAYLLNLPKKRYICMAFLFSLLIGSVFRSSFPLVAVARLPIFIIGMGVGQLLCEGREISRMQEACLYLLSAAGLTILGFFAFFLPGTLWDLGTAWYPFILIMPGFLVLLCHLFHFFQNHRCLSYINQLLGACGRITLELYLIHVFFFSGIGQNNWITLALSLALAFPYHYAIQKITSWYSRKFTDAAVFMPKEGL